MPVRGCGWRLAAPTGLSRAAAAAAAALAKQPSSADVKHYAARDAHVMPGGCNLSSKVRTWCACAATQGRSREGSVFCLRLQDMAFFLPIRRMTASNPSLLPLLQRKKKRSQDHSPQIPTWGANHAPCSPLLDHARPPHMSTATEARTRRPARPSPVNVRRGPTRNKSTRSPASILDLRVHWKIDPPQSQKACSVLSCI